MSAAFQHTALASMWAQAARPAWGAVLRVLYPPRCLGCGASLPEEARPLCHRCLPRLERPEAARLNALLAHLPEANAVFDGVFALWLFDAEGVVQRVQHVLKYGNRPHVGTALGQLMGTAYQAGGGAPPDLVLPIPLHRARFYERGYNQSAMLARGLGRALDAPVSEAVLVRRRATRSQTNLSRRSRWDNVAGAFDLVTPEAVAGRRVLLIDDVMTTGATLAAAAAVLQQAGAAAIVAATLALAR